MSAIMPIGVNTETREQLLERATKQRVQIAHMRADMVKLELYRDNVESVEEQNRVLKKENNRLASAVGRLNKKIENFTGKVENKAGGKNGETVISEGADSGTGVNNDTGSVDAGEGNC